MSLEHQYELTAAKLVDRRSPTYMEKLIRFFDYVTVGVIQGDTRVAR